MTKRGGHLLLGLLVLVLQASGCSGLPSRAPTLIAHRGSGAALASPDTPPENTLSALRYGWSHASWCEIDCRLTLDGELVVIHDPTTGRVAEGNLAVADSTLAQLRTLDVGSWKGAAWNAERIPTLAEALALIPKGGGLVVDVKPGPADVPAIVEEVERSGRGPESVIFASYNRDSLLRFKELAPGYLCLQEAYTTSAGEAVVLCGDDNRRRQMSWPDLVRVLDRDGIELVGAGQQAPLRSLLELTGESRIRLVVFSVETPEEARQWLADGAWAVASDHVGRMSQLDSSRESPQGSGPKLQETPREFQQKSGRRLQERQPESPVPSEGS